MSSAALSQVCDYDFMRCEKCGRVVTKPEVLRAIGDGTAAGTGKPCPCGGMKLTPIDLPWWGWLLPRVWVFAWQRIRSQSLRQTFSRNPPPDDTVRRPQMGHVDDELEQLPERR